MSHAPAPSHPVLVMLAAIRQSRSGGASIEPLPAAEGIEDAALVARAVDGDRWAMEALYRRHVRRVANAVTRTLRRSQDADDVVQEAFLIAFSRLGELREPAAFRGWLARIAINEVRQRLRKRHWFKRLALDREPDDVSLESLADDHASPEVRTELAKLDRVLGRLGPDERLAWTLRYVEGWPLDECATALGCSLATVKRRIKAAKDTIDSELARGSR